MDGMTVKLKNKTIGDGADLPTLGVPEAMEPSIPIAALHIPTPIVHDSASIVKRPRFQVDRMVPDARGVKLLLHILDMYRLFYHQLNVASKVLSKIRPAREKSSLLWLRLAYW